jgi:hypothetical protein
MQSTYWLEKVLKMICLYVNALLCTLQHTVLHLAGVSSMHLSGVTPFSELTLLQRAQKCTDVHGDHFQHLL